MSAEPTADTRQPTGDAALAYGRIRALPAAHPLLRAMRLLQWTKNSLVLAGLLFSVSVFELEAVIRAGAAVIVFCAVSSAMYLLNDVRDAEHDRHHPRKRTRPIAAGEVSEQTAVIVAIVLIAAGLGGALLIRPEFAGVVCGYLALMIAYSYGLKRMVILDVFAISAGFVLRAAGGAVAIDVPISPWLYMCTMLGALFIGFGKRRNELALLQGDAAKHRANLDDYSIPVLDQIIAVVASATVMTYSLYTFDAASVPENKAMMLTIPFVAYAVFRYLLLMYRRDLGGSPEIVLVTDKPLFLCIVGWGFTSVAILYLT